MAYRKEPIEYPVDLTILYHDYKASDEFTFKTEKLREIRVLIVRELEALSTDIRAKIAEKITFQPRTDVVTLRPSSESDPIAKLLSVLKNNEPITIGQLKDMMEKIRGIEIEENTRPANDNDIPLKS